jgi:histidine ammonia-lyase
MNVLVLRGEGLSLAEAVAAAETPGARISAAPEAMARVAASRAVIDRAVADGRPVYGVTTGFGKLQNVAIPPEDRLKLQRNLVLSHAAGIGAPIAREDARLILLLRVQSLLRGHSGATPALLDRLIRIFNAGVAPVVPEQGSVGASGDLAPLAHVALLAIGEGDAFAADGTRAPAADVLRGAKLDASFVLREKEGLALLNGTQFMTALAARALVGADRLLRLADLAVASSLDALLFSVRPFDPRLHAARPHPGQAATADNVRRLLDGSTIGPSHAGPHKVQDAYCVRCAPQVHGASRDAIRHVRDVVVREMNATTDNPLVFADAGGDPSDGEVISGGNFHGEPVALAGDYLAIALSEIGAISERRIETLVNPDLSSGLPAFLAPHAGVESGLMIAQVAAAALASENKSLAHPASVDSIPTSANQEDHVSMGPIAVRKARTILRNVERIVGIELLAAAEGLERRRPLRSGRGVEAAISHLRASVPAMTSDRVLSTDFEKVDALVRDGSLVAVAEAAAGPLAGL